MKFLLAVMLLTLTGCATTESLNEFYEKVNREDGISRDEAAIIAKKWLIESKYEGDFQVIGPVSTALADLWQVTFLYKSVSYYEKVLDVYVDNKTGEVKASEIREKGTPAVTKDPWDGFNGSK
jgi:hypothetical protein